MDEVARVREKTDLVALISEYIPLKKMGRNFKANCPFHNEKTPSFVVSPERQIWHCFGCAKGGDCFTFLMEYENIEFGESLRTLAKKAGIELTKSSFQTGLSTQKENMYRLNRLAMEYYHFVLTAHSVGKVALEYLTNKRKLTPKLIKTFQLGFAPKGGAALCGYLMKKKGYKKQELIDVGLAFEGRGGVVDFFRDRIIFPLSDARGNIVGFSGRTMGDEQPKYINTRETLIYHKGDLFFGLNIAKDEIKKTDQAIVMEGELDVISSYKQGVGNAIAIKGTALTEHQVTLLARFAQKVTLCFDQDSAGYEATKRSLSLLEKKGLTTTVITFADKDADEAANSDPIAFKKAVKNDIPIYDFIISRLLQTFDKSAEGKRKISSELVPMLSHIENEIVKEHYLKKISTALDTSYESLYREVEKFAKTKEQDVSVVFKKQKQSRREMLEMYLLSLILQSDKPHVFLQKTEEILKGYTFATPAYQKIMDMLKTYLLSHSIFKSEELHHVMPQELLQTYDMFSLFPLPPFLNDEAYTQEIEKVAKELQMLSVKEKLQTLTEQIRAKEKSGEDAEVETLKKEFSTLLSKMPK
ncbi:MAG TPA: DNA primase [Candidatus Saccharimonadales bacterium]|nr:DNA primase [Candidatus Saccharimonadales bacterium]